MTADTNHLILAAGVIGVLSILAGLWSRRIGAPLLLVFLVIGMLVGHRLEARDSFENFRAAYMAGSIALAVILFEGGLKTSLHEVRLALFPSLALATVGVVLTACIVGGLLKLITDAGWPGVLLAGAVVAPTDAAAVAALLRRARIHLPERVQATLELESGLNDPASVFLTVLLIGVILDPAPMGAWSMAAEFAIQMGGGAALGSAGGVALLSLLRRLPLEASLATVLALAGCLAVFGLAQTLGTSGFLAVYIAATIVGTSRFEARAQVGHFFEGLAWLAQIVLFVFLGLLVSPIALLPFLGHALFATVVLLLVARPLAVFVCLAPFGFGLREMTFVAWVGLRGAVPIYLSVVPAAYDPRGIRLFESVTVVVIASLIAQGWTIRLVAEWLGYGSRVGKGGAA